MSTESKSNYFKELTLNLQQEGFTVCPEKDGLLPIELNNQQFCLALNTGAIRYWNEDVADDVRREALDRVTTIAKVTAEYMNQMETAPQLGASGLSGDYRLLADFNDVVLAGHPTKYGVQFVTWERVQNRTALHQGNYYGPSVGIGGYTAAKQDFATRSGLIPHNALFTPEQLTEIYRSIHETLENTYLITDERRKCLESTAEQLEHSIPDLEERISLSIQKEPELNAADAPEQNGMQFC